MTTNEHTVIRLTVVLDVRVSDVAALTAAAVEALGDCFDDETEREAKAAENKRRSWATRRDWGGTGPVTPTPTRTPTTPAPAPAAPTTPVPAADDDTPAKGGEDGE